MAEAPFTNPAVYQTPNLPMRGVPESVMLYARPDQIQRFLTDARVAGVEAPTLPNQEDLSRWRKVGRFLTTPLSLVAAQFSRETAPRAWDIVTQKAEFSFRDVLMDRGIDEKGSRWWGFALDMILDPLNFIPFIGLTKFGARARAFTRARDLKSALPAAKAAIKGIENAKVGKGLGPVLADLQITKEVSEQAKRGIAAIASNANFEFGTTWYQQAARGQRALLSLSIPFTSVKGIAIVPREVSMMAFAIPSAVRGAFTQGARKAFISGNIKQFISETGLAMVRKGSGKPLAKDIDYLFRGLLRGAIGKATKDLVDDLGKEVSKIGLDDWEIIEAAFESRKNLNLAKTNMNAKALMAAGIPAKLASRPEVQKVLNRMRDVMQGTITVEKALGLKISQLDDDINYLLHYLTPEGREALQKSDVFGMSPRAWTENNISATRRLEELRGKTIADINKLAREGKLKLLKGKKIDKFFDVNPLTITITRMHRSIRSITGASYLRAMGETFGRKIPLAKELGELKARQSEIRAFFRKVIPNITVSDIRKIAKFTDKQIAKGEKLRGLAIGKALRQEAKNVVDELSDISTNIVEIRSARANALGRMESQGFRHPSTSDFLGDYRFADESIVQEIDKLFGKFTAVESISDFFKHYDAVLSFWKGSTLAIFPAYHTRNYVDNLWRNYLGGVSPISYYYARASLGQLKKFGIDPDTIKVTTTNGEVFTLTELVNEAQNLSVVGHNVRDAEFIVNQTDEALQAIAQKRTTGLRGVINPRAQENTFIRGGFDIGRKLIEDPARMAHYIDKRIKGFSELDSLLSVKKYLFDYEDLTLFEKNILRRVFPFYSWTRFNIPFQIEQVLSKPGKIGKIAIITNSKIIPDIFKQDNREVESRFLGEWQREGAPLFVGRNPNKPDEFRYFMIDGWMSTFDLVRLFDPGKLLVNNLVPVLREPFAQIANFDFFFRRPIVSMSNWDDSLKEKENFLAMSMNRRLVHVLRNVRAFNELDRFLKNMSAENEPIRKRATNAFLRGIIGGSLVTLSEEKGAVSLRFRLRRIALEGRRAYTRALRRNKPEEANEIMQATIARLMRGF